MTLVIFEEFSPGRNSTTLSQSTGKLGFQNKLIEQPPISAVEYAGFSREINVDKGFHNFIY